MTKETEAFGLPYPEDADEPNGPAQIKALADDVDTQLGYAGAAFKKKIVATEQSRTSTSYIAMGTADEVTGLVTAEHDLIEVIYRASWKGATENAAVRAALFVDSTQIKGSVGDSSSFLVQAAAHYTLSTAKDAWHPLSACSFGLVSLGTGFFIAEIEESVPYVLGVTPNTEQAAYRYEHGSEVKTASFVDTTRCLIHPPAGTHTISVQFKASAGAVTAKNRKLYARVLKAP